MSRHTHAHICTHEHMQSLHRDKCLLTWCHSSMQSAKLALQSQEHRACLMNEPLFPPCHGRAAGKRSHQSQSPPHHWQQHRSQEALQSWALSQPPSVRILMLPVIPSTLKGVKQKKGTAPTTTRTFFHICGQCSSELLGNEPKQHGTALLYIITLPSKSACNHKCLIAALK